MNFGLSIKLNTILGVAGVLLVLLALWRWVDAEERAQAVEQALVVGAIADQLLSAAGDLAVERGTSNAVIANPAAATDAQRATIQQRRAQAGAAIQTALNTLPTAWRGLDDVAQAVQALQAAEAEVNGLRTQVDAARAKDPALIGRWFGTITRLITATERLRLTTAQRVDAKTPQELVGDFELKHAFYVMSEFAGRERGGVSGIIAAARPFTPAEYRIQGENRGAIQTAWATAQAAAAHRADLLAAPVERIRRSYFQEFEPTRQAVFQASESAAAYPVSAPDWFAKASLGVDAMLAAQKVIAEDFNRRSGQVLAEAARQRWTAQAICALALAIGVVSIIVVRFHIAHPILGLASAMRRMSDSDLNAPINHHRRRDEIGEMARALTVFRDGMAEAEALRQERDAAAQQAETQKQAALAAMADTVERSVTAAAASVSGKSARVHDLARSMAASARQMNQNAQAVSRSAEDALSNAEIVSAAAEELSCSIRGVFDHVQQAATRNRATVETGERAQRQIGALKESVSEISKIAGLIAGIAQQTNLLALNATIEAARAGEAGKGFAVVAGEVKSLANQTANSTETIKAELTRIMERTDASVDAIADVRGAIVAMDALWSEVADALNQQQAATTEIAQAVAQSTTVTRTVSDRIGEVIADAAQVGGHAQEVETAVGSVVVEVDHLRGAIVGAVTAASDNLAA